MSNVPAKAGLPVIRRMLGEFSNLVGDSGIAAIVIVKTLSDFAEQTIRDANGTILFVNRTREYTVLHYRKMDVTENSAWHDPYIRTTMQFTFGSVEMPVKTAYGLPEFDSLSYSTCLVLDLLKKYTLSGSLLVCNPGQGYIPLAAVSLYKEMLSSVTLAGRDLLSLSISQMNSTNV